MIIESVTVEKENVSAIEPKQSPLPASKEFNDRVIQFRVYLKPDQEKTFSQLYGNQRFFRNKFLAVLEETYGMECDARKSIPVVPKEGAGIAEEITTNSGIPYMGKYEMYKFVPAMQRMWPFLRLSSVTLLRTTVHNLDSAYKNFFSGRGGKPKMAKRKTKATLCFEQSLKLTGNQLTLQGFAEPIEVNFGRLGKKKGIPTTRLKKCYLKRDSDLRYYVSMVWVGEESIYKPYKAVGSIGLDEGIKNLLVTSDGYRYKNPRALGQFEVAIVRLQRKLASKENFLKARFHWHRGQKSVIYTKNCKKLRLKIARLHRKIRNIRKYFRDKVVSTVTERAYRNNHAIHYQKVNHKAQMKNGKLAKSLGDASNGQLMSDFEKTCKRKKIPFFAVSQWKSTTNTCHTCGTKREVKLALDQRNWFCGSCRTWHNRDRNAACQTKSLGDRFCEKDNLDQSLRRDAA